MTDIKLKYTEIELVTESNKIRKRYPGCIPVIVTYSNEMCLDKNKFICNGEYSVGQFMHVLRRRINLKPTDGIFAFVNGSLPPCSHTLNQVLSEYNYGGFLFMDVIGESTFGS
jgi:GABA(A) receptor-associated protein